MPLITRISIFRMSSLNGVSIASSRRSVMSNIVTFIYSLNITVEPLIFFLAASNSAKGIVTPDLSEAKMTRVYPAPAGLSPTELKKFYNKKMVEWDNNYQYVNIPIASIMGIIYGGYSDHFGRKLPLVLGILSVIIETAVIAYKPGLINIFMSGEVSIHRLTTKLTVGSRLLIWSPQSDWPLQWFFPTAAVAGFFGDFFLTMSCINAYVTDTFQNKITLSKRMIVVSICFSLGQFVSSRLMKILLDAKVSHIVILGSAEGIYMLVFLCAIVFLSDWTPGEKHVILVEDEEIPNEMQPSQTEQRPHMSICQIVSLSVWSIWEAFKMFAVSRNDHRRLFLYLCFLANFLDQFVFGEEKGLIGTYTKLNPFHWDASEYASYKSWRPIAQIIGLFFGMLVFKHWLKLRDTLIICFAIASMGACVLLIGLAQNTWEIFASLAPGSLHGLLNPLTFSFLSCVVEPNELGKAFAVSSIAQQLAGYAQTAVLQNIYIATVDWYQGFVWLLMTVISFFAVGIYGIVHIMAKRESVGI